MSFSYFSLLAPNRACNGIRNVPAGPGKGQGGKPDAEWPNCVPQGNLLIIQDWRYPESRANDSPWGGCFYFDFVQPVSLVNTGLIDIEEPQGKITVCLTTKN